MPKRRQLLAVIVAVLAAWVVGSSAIAQTRRVTFPPAEAPPPPPVKQPPKTQSNSELTHILDGHGPDMRKTQQRTPPPPTNLTVIYKVQYGSTLEYVHPNGVVQKFEQWKSFPNDASSLIVNVNRRLADGNNYQYATKPLSAKSFDPLDVPILFMAGDYDFVLSPDEVENLRKYVVSGGTIVFNAARGRMEFNRAVARELRKVFPTKQLATLPPDHPVFNARYRIQQVPVRIDGVQQQQTPEVLSIDIGTRAAAILVPMGLGAAWSNAPYHPDGRHIVGESAIRLGVNLVSYVLGSTEYSRFLAQEFPVYGGKTHSGDTFRFAQVRYAGSWDDNPAVQNMALSTVHQAADVNVDYAPVSISLDDPSLGNYPLLFMSGHHDFRLSKEECEGLAKFLKRGGMLLASASAGLRPFDKAFRREIARAIPKAEFIKLPPSHPAFVSGWNSSVRVNYTQAALRENPSLENPEFWGVFIDGRLAVLYTPYDLMSSVNRECNAYSKGMTPDDADRILTSIVMFVLSN